MSSEQPIGAPGLLSAAVQLIPRINPAPPSRHYVLSGAHLSVARRERFRAWFVRAVRDGDQARERQIELRMSVILCTGT